MGLPLVHAASSTLVIGARFFTLSLVLFAGPGPCPRTQRIASPGLAWPALPYELCRTMQVLLGETSAVCPGAGASDFQVLAGLHVAIAI